MHNLAFIVIDRKGLTVSSSLRVSVELTVGRLMAPGNEEHNEEGFWDFYQIGGRWTGTFDPSYNPMKDPRNIEPCSLCDSGIRYDLGMDHWNEAPKDRRRPNGGILCNACGGKKAKLKWPTDWVPFEGDIETADHVLDLLTSGSTSKPHCVLGVGFSSFSDSWNPESRQFEDNSEHESNVLEALSRKNHLVVVVDYHS